MLVFRFPKFLNLDSKNCMQRPKLSIFFSYALALGFITCWWWIAFRPTQDISLHFNGPLQIVEEPILSISHLQLLPLHRETLHKALAGDFPLITRLIADWDVEAQILEADGYIGIKRLSSEEFIYAQKVGRALSQKTSQPTNTTFLPQSYLAASYLLALLLPEQIAAIPAGLRRQTFLYPEQLTSGIKLNLDNACAEQIFQCKPKKAFIAPYSLPSSIDMLQKQGIEICSINHLNSFSDLTEALKLIGKAVNEPDKAELLAIFMSASLHAIDNRLIVTAHHSKKSLESVYCFNCDLSFSVPTEQMIIGQLFKRLKINNGIETISDYQEKQNLWKIPLENEQIGMLNPSCLIISTTQSVPSLKQRIKQNKALTELDAVQNNRVYWVNEEVLESTSQYIVLAYYDLYLALAHAHFSG